MICEQIKLKLALDALGDLLQSCTKVSLLFPVSLSTRLHRKCPQSFAQSQGRNYSDFRVQTAGLSHCQHPMEERKPAYPHQ